MKSRRSRRSPLSALRVVTALAAGVSVLGSGPNVALSPRGWSTAQALAVGPQGAGHVAKPAPYFGQPAPGFFPTLFAPEIVASMQMTRTPVFTSNGREVFWSTSLGQNKGRLMTASLTAAGWSEAAPVPFSTGAYFDHNPAPSPDGKRLVFASNRPVPGKEATTMPGTTVATSDLWMSERTATGWSAPVALGPEINTTADEDVPVLTRDATLYFGSSRPGAPGPAAIYRSRFAGGRFGAPELLPAPVTTSAGEMCNYVSPDESLLGAS